MWDEKIHSQLAPELQEIHPDMTPTYDIEDIKDAVDGKHNRLPYQSLGSLTVGNAFYSGALAKAVIDAAPVSFKLPPGVSTAMAPGPAHMLAYGDKDQVGLVNTEKNHVSGVTKDSVAAAVHSMRTLGGGGTGGLDAWGTRQTSEHRKFPTYANYLKSMMDNFQISPGFGVGAVPAQVMRSTAWINPSMPFGPSDSALLGSGVDFFGLSNAPRMTATTKEGFNPVLPMTFSPTQFQLNDPSQQGSQTGFSIPQSAIQQLPKEVTNIFPKSIEYAVNGLGQHPMSGMTPVFM